MGREAKYAGGVEILLWLVPPAVVTVLAMVWVAWLGRAGRGEIDPEVAVRRLAKALDREKPRHPVRPYAAMPAPHDRSSGVAVRRSQETRRRAS